ncbi:RNA methyltransferase [Actinomycetaceae bacterium MB13-C1-2]|nr:RNA methyltransferase [Actinomycetaceae bacterium MB13-C1-2]
MLDNTRSERIRKVTALSGRSARKKSGSILVEGPGAVKELVQFRAECILDVYFSEEAIKRNAALFQLANESVQWVHVVSPEVSDRLSKESQGVVAVARKEAINAVGIDSESGKSAFWVLLPKTQDPGNLGTLVRTADAMGARGVLLGQGTCEVSNPKVIRASAGSVFHLPVAYGDFFDAVTELQRKKVVVLGTALHTDSVALSDLMTDTVSSLDGPHAWVFGNEARGLTAHEMSVCDRLVHIPMHGEAESLNVASAAAMCMFASSLAG